MKFTLLLLLAVSFNSVASEVDALNSQTQSEPQALQVAAVNTGVDARWTVLPNDQKASKRETREFENRVEGISAGLNRDLNQMISTRLDLLIEDLQN